MRGHQRRGKTLFIIRSFYTLTPSPSPSPSFPSLSSPSLLSLLSSHWLGLLLNLVFIDDFVDAEKGFQFQIIVVEIFAFIEEYLSTGTIVTGHSKSGEHILDVFRIIFHMICAEVLSMAVGSKTIEELPPATWILALGDFEAIKATGIALEHGLWDIIDCMSVKEEARC